MYLDRHRVTAGWRQDKDLYQLVAKTQTLIEENSSDVQTFIAGGAIRDLVYGTEPGIAPKDIDIYVCSKEELGEKYYNQLSSSLRHIYTDVDHLDDEYEKVFADGSKRFHVINCVTQWRNSNKAYSIQVIEGKPTIEETVSHFDWYECCWYIKNVLADTAFRPFIEDIKKINNLVDVDAIKQDSLTLLKWNNAFKTLQRGLYISKRNKLKIRKQDISTLVGAIELGGEEYGEYLR